MSSYQLTSTAGIAAFWACRESAHAQVHHATRDRTDYSPTTVSNLHHELVWTIEAAQELSPTYDVAANVASRCWTRPQAEGGIALCDDPLDEATVRRIVDQARTFIADLDSSAAATDPKGPDNAYHQPQAPR